MADKVRLYLSKKKSGDKLKFTYEDWKKLRRTLDIASLGLSRAEIRLLETLGEQKYTRLTNLSAKLGLSKSCLQRDHELYLQKHSLMEISPHGRMLTSKGQEYLKSLEDW